MKKEINELNTEEALKNLIKAVKIEGYEKIENHNIKEYEQLLLKDNNENNLKGKTAYEKVSLISKKLSDKEGPITIKIHRSWANIKLKAEIDTIYLNKEYIKYKDKASGLTLSGLFVALYRDNYLYNTFPVEVLEEIL